MKMEKKREDKIPHLIPRRWPCRCPRITGGRSERDKTEWSFTELSFWACNLCICTGFHTQKSLILDLMLVKSSLWTFFCVLPVVFVFFPLSLYTLYFHSLDLNFSRLTTALFVLWNLSYNLVHSLHSTTSVNVVVYLIYLIKTRISLFSSKFPM